MTILSILKDSLIGKEITFGFATESYDWCEFNMPDTVPHEIITDTVVDVILIEAQEIQTGFDSFETIGSDSYKLLTKGGYKVLIS